MTLEEAIETVRKMYEVGLKMPFVYNPVAWALHQAWKIADIKGNHKKEKADVPL